MSEAEKTHAGELVIVEHNDEVSFAWLESRTEIQLTLDPTRVKGPEKKSCKIEFRLYFEAILYQEQAKDSV